jgi:hypothetical protein
MYLDERGGPSTWVADLFIVLFGLGARATYFTPIPSSVGDEGPHV